VPIVLGLRTDGMTAGMGIRHPAIVGLILLLALQQGCGTVVNLVLGVETGEKKASPHFSMGAFSMETRIYGGLQNDVHGIGEAVSGEEGFWWSALTFLFFTFIDFPLSLAADTLTLPYTIPHVLTRENKEPLSPANPAPPK
jgi:hypothetical protein